MKYEHYTPEAVILANGEYPSHPLPLQMLENAEFVVCCDGAANEYILRGHTPDVIIGDGDSLSPEYKELFSPIVHQIADQETNDQTKAVHFLQKKGFRRIAIVGATGKREDHTLGNISLLIQARFHYLLLQCRCIYKSKDSRCHICCCIELFTVTYLIRDHKISDTFSRKR